MYPNLNFGTFNIPSNAEGSVTYSVPGIFPKEFMNNISISKDENNIVEEVTESEVSHENFFGENFRRVKNILINAK